MDEDQNSVKNPPARELKVKVPLAVHVQLHSVKILTGKRISDVVTDALTRYFAADGEEAHRAAHGSRPPGLALPVENSVHARACGCTPCGEES